MPTQRRLAVALFSSSDKLQPRESFILNVSFKAHVESTCFLLLLPFLLLFFFLNQNDSLLERRNLDITDSIDSSWLLLFKWV